MPKEDIRTTLVLNTRRIMMFGLTTATFTVVHVWLSVLGIGTGFIVLFGLLTRKRLDGWTALFLASTVATSVTGFGFPFDHLLPSHKVGIMSLLVFAAAWRASFVRCSRATRAMPLMPSVRWAVAG